jgi:AcrR family transcriptional regulator
MNQNPGLPLRPRKLARAKQALLRAAVARLDSRTLEEIPVKELCDAAGVSEASFFNYFPKKSDLLVYFVRIWSLDVSWRALHGKRGATARESIEEIFLETARQAAAHPGVMSEVIAHQARMETPPDLHLTAADRVVAFPDRPGIEDVPAGGLDTVLPPLIDRAVLGGELPESTDRNMALLGFSTIFLGLPVMARRLDPPALGEMYIRLIGLFWEGLIAKGKRSP